jgi:hypothetical protein
MKVIRGVLISLLILVVCAVPVLAAYSATITVAETTGNAYSMLPYSVLFSTETLIAQGYTSTASGLDVLSSSGPIMLTNAALLTTITTLPGNSTATSMITTGNTPATSFAIIPGDGGNFTVAHSASLEGGLGIPCEVEIRGYFNTSVVGDIATYGTNPYIYIPSNGTITTVMGSWANTSLNATSVATGVHTLKFAVDGATEKLYIDNILANSTATPAYFTSLGGWTAMKGGCNKYWEYMKVTINGVQVAYYQPESYIIGTNLPDRAGTPQNATFNFGTNPAGVTATLGILRGTGTSSAGSGSDPQSPGIVPTVVTPGMTASEASLQGTDIFPYELIKAVSDITTYPVTVLWAAWAFGWAMIFAFIVFVLTRGHFFFAGIAGAIPVIFYTLVQVLPLFVIVFAILGIIGGGLLDRERY